MSRPDCLYCGINEAQLTDYRSQNQGTAHEQVGTYPACKPCFGLSNEAVWAMVDRDREATIEYLLKIQTVDVTLKHYDVTQDEVSDVLNRLKRR